MTEQGLIERAKRLGIDIKDTASILDAMERQAASLEAARSQISGVVDEVRMHNTLSRARLRWLTEELDKVQAQLAAGAT